MKKIFLIVGLLFSVCAFAQIEKVLPDQKNPARLYNDFTKAGNFLTNEQAQALENKLVAYNDSTSSQVAIVVVDGLNNYEANEYATALGRKWGIGGKEFNNGVLILISTGGGEGNRDAYIAVGYGLEGAIPDMTAAYIVDHEIIENFKQGNYYRGLDEAVDAIIKAAGGEYKAPQGYGKRRGLSPGQIFLIIMIIWIVLGVIGRGGGKGGGYASRRGYRGFWGPTLGGGLGSGWGGGGGGGGGFGGFGGGSFGGGGAGGKW
ncbi:MAG TPA: TPM domain-containing protein [Chitinophagaceae bacterium]|nr:TPM domain-containing protein [Chitinophagaceae bacterium]